MSVEKLNSYLKKGYKVKISTTSEEFRPQSINSFLIEIKKARQTNNFVRVHTNITDVNISCGVKQMSGLFRDYNIRSLELMLKDPKDVNAFLKDMYSYYASETKRENNAAYVLVSNNKFNKNVNEVLDNICIYKTKWTLNPNSGNKIKIWTI